MKLKCNLLFLSFIYLVIFTSFASASTTFYEGGFFITGSVTPTLPSGGGGGGGYEPYTRANETNVTLEPEEPTGRNFFQKIWEWIIDICAKGIHWIIRFIGFIVESVLKVVDPVLVSFNK